MSEPARVFPPTQPVARPMGAIALAPAKPQAATPPAAATKVKPAPRRRSHWQFWAWVIGIGAPLTAVNLLGASYYLAPMAVRVRHPWHRGCGRPEHRGLSRVIALVIFFLLWLYPLRKKFASWRSWDRWGAGWMSMWRPRWHCRCCWRSTLRGTRGLIGLGLAAMLVVIASGVVGRYLYTRIPRARSGVELTRDEVSAKRRELIELLAATTGSRTKSLIARWMSGRSSPSRAACCGSSGIWCPTT